jgi:hypothetical protein
MQIQILSARLTTRNSGTAVFMHGQNRVVVPFRKRNNVVFAETAIVGGKDVTDALESATFRAVERSISACLQKQQANALVVESADVQQYSRLNEWLQRPAVLGVIAMCTFTLVGLFGGGS